jgi:hypothetical protein
MREAESLYLSACAVVQHDFYRGAGELRPHFTVIIGADRNEVHSDQIKENSVPGQAEIWMKKWNPLMFAQGVTVLAFNQMLTKDVIKQLGDRAVRYSNATVDVAGFK